MATGGDPGLGADQLIIVSPHAVVRWRQGRLTLASGAKPVVLNIRPEVLALLHLLAEPRSFAEVESAGLSIDPVELRPLLRLLVRAGAVEVLGPGRRGKGPWWDPRDRGRFEASLMSLIQVAHGFTASAQAGFCVDAWGRPVPWLARPVIDFLDQLDLRPAKVFEFGGGASTHYWARRCRSVTCVESHERWFERLSRELEGRATLLFRRTAETFAKSILEGSEAFDVVLLDAAPAFRVGCVGPALERLAPGGMVILDDAPFYPEAAAALRVAGLLEVDFTGYCPLEDNLQTTSLFFRRDFDMPRRASPSPAFPFGSPGFRWDRFRPEPDR